MTQLPGETASGGHHAGSTVEARLRETFARSRDVVLRAHERAQQALDRASRIREALRAERGVLDAYPAQQEARRPVRLQQRALDEGARSLREKDRFLATVSHELRQPLSACCADSCCTGAGSHEPPRAGYRVPGERGAAAPR